MLATRLSFVQPFIKRVSRWLLVSLCLAGMHGAIADPPDQDSGLTVVSSSNDWDGDSIVNTADIDDDNDGIPDVHELDAHGRDRDTDADGIPDRLDLDSDNDGIVDWRESGSVQTLNLSVLRQVGARLVGDVGTNGLLNIFEAPADSGRLAYRLVNTDVNEDAIPDYLDLDSDNDGWPDLREAGVWPGYDSDNDARVDAPVGTVGMDGIADFLQRINDQSCCDLDSDGSDDLPNNTDMADLPDFQDLDSDNDGVSDIIELNGTDEDGDGHVDNFIDIAGRPDGMDDGLLTFPYTPQDANGNGVFDHIEFVVSPSNPDPVVPDPEGEVPVPQEPDSPVVQDDDPDSGVVKTGLNASGCTIFAGESDITLYFLLLISIFACIRQRYIKKGL